MPLVACFGVQNQTGDRPDASNLFLKMRILVKIDLSTIQIVENTLSVELGHYAFFHNLTRATPVGANEN